MSRVFIIDDKHADLNIFHNALENVETDVFFTENAYKFVRYAQELSPDLYIVNTNMKNTNSRAVIEYLISQKLTAKAPLVAISDNPQTITYDGISHYLKSEEISRILPELVRSYCEGGRHYDVLLVEKDLSSPLSITDNNNLSCFKVNDSRGAQIFLGKNHTKVVAIHCCPTQYKILKRQLKNDNAIYIENVVYLNKLVSFIK